MGYIPQNLTVEHAADLRRRDPSAYREQALDSIAAQLRGMLALQRLGAMAFDRDTGILTLAYERGVSDAFEIPELASGTARLVGGLAQDGRASVTCLALSGEPIDIARTDRLLLDLFPEDSDLHRWITLAGRHVRFQGLPARVCRLESSRLIKFASAVNGLVAQRELAAPVVIGEVSLTDGDAGPGPVIDDGDGWSVIGEMLNTAGCAAWITIDSSLGAAGGGAQPSMRRPNIIRVIVADGTPETSERLNRAMAGAPAAANLHPAQHNRKSNVEARELARKQLIKIPMP
jgi:urocanate hydratase